MDKVGVGLFSSAWQNLTGDSAAACMSPAEQQ